MADLPSLRPPPSGSSSSFAPPPDVPSTLFDPSEPPEGLTIIHVDEPSILPPPPSGSSSSPTPPKEKEIWGLRKRSIFETKPLPPPGDFPEDYTRPIAFNNGASWSEFTAAAETLQVDESDDGNFFTLSPLKGCRNLRALLSQPAIYARRVLLDSQHNKDYTKISKEDVANFRDRVENAMKDFELYEKYFGPAADRIHDYSSVEAVMAQIPAHYDNARSERITSIIERCVQSEVCLTKEYLYLDFAAFLPECDFLQPNVDLDECLKRVKANPSFQQRGFDAIQERKLKLGLKSYLENLKLKIPVSKYKALIEEERESDRYASEWGKLIFPGELISPIHFLAHQRRSKGYSMQHEVLEIVKFRCHLGIFWHGVPPLYPPETVQTFRSPSSSRLLKKRKRALTRIRL